MKSSYCGSAACVDVVIHDDYVSVRDEQHVICIFTFTEWRAFVLGVKAGQFDIPATMSDTIYVDTMLGT